MAKLQPWEKPWVRDFRGTNRSRPTPVDRGLEWPQPTEATSIPQVYRERVHQPLQLHRPHLPARVFVDRAHGPVAARMMDNKAIIKKEASQSSASIALAIGMEETSTLSSDYRFGDVYSLTDPRLRLTEPRLDPRGLLGGGRPRSSLSRLSLRDEWGHPDVRVQTIRAFGDIAKRGDAANYGLFKMNWFMIKQTETGRQLIADAARTLNNRSPDPSASTAIQHTVGRRINADTAIATSILEEAMARWSTAPPNPANPQPNNFWAGHRMGQSGLENTAGIDWHDIRDYYDAVQTISAIISSDPRTWTDERRFGVYVPAI